MNEIFKTHKLLPKIFDILKFQISNNFYIPRCLPISLKILLNLKFHLFSLWNSLEALSKIASHVSKVASLSRFPLVMSRVKENFAVIESRELIRIRLTCEIYFFVATVVFICQGAFTTYLCGNLTFNFEKSKKYRL